MLNTNKEIMEKEKFLENLKADIREINELHKILDDIEYEVIGRQY